MNEIRLNGTLRSGPEKRSDEAARALLAFNKEQSVVRVFALGAAAQELCQFNAGDGVLITGQLLISEDGTAEILAARIFPHSKQGPMQRVPWDESRSRLANAKVFERGIRVRPR